MYKRLEKTGVFDLCADGRKYKVRYLELFVKGKWIYYDCIREDGARMILRFDYENYGLYVMKDNEIPDGEFLKSIHNKKYTTATDEYYYLSIGNDIKKD